MTSNGTAEVVTYSSMMQEVVATLLAEEVICRSSKEVAAMEKVEEEICSSKTVVVT